MISLTPDRLRRAEGYLRKLVDEIRSKGLDDAQSSIVARLRACEDALSIVRAKLSAPPKG